MVSVIFGILGWSLIAGVVDLPSDAWFNSIWLLATLFGVGAVAALSTRPPTLLLFLPQALSLMLCWIVRNGIE